jgi:7-dehydrocholesterol reductase
MLGSAEPRGNWLAGNGSWLSTALFPVLAMASMPPLVLLFWVVVTYYDGSVLAALGEPLGVLAKLPGPSLVALAMLLAWLGFALLLLRVLPGRRVLGPVTPRGNQPEYRLNGVAAFIVTHVVWFGATSLGLFPATIIDHFGELLTTANLLALGLCVVLYIKGLKYPSSSDAGGTSKVLWDYYWGTELHPRMFGVQLKQLINCRFAMMGWSIILLSHAAAQIESHGQLSSSMLVCVGLQVIYVFKFFVWEGGYFNSLDIMHDRFGFYICWGICVWLPGVYTLSGFYLVEHPRSLSPLAAVAIFAFGLLALRINYAADEQRQRARATKGDTKIWGRTPQLIRATYVPADGQPRENLLLASGWWGIARHFHYVPEIALACAWTLPVGFEHALPWLYPVFLSVLLMHRAVRDDERCARKYGEAWAEYCRRVPWKMVPGVF